MQASGGQNAAHANRRDILKGAAAFAGAGLLTGRASPAFAQETRPNIVFIMADDLGYADLSSYGRRDYRTPHIDGLAAQGIKFTQAYANSAVCSATRMALITGRYQYRLAAGLEEPIGAEDLGLPPGLPTMPEQFRRAGYHTVLIGKWHLGLPPSFGPLRSGYDRFFGIYGGGTDYWKHGQKLALMPIEATSLIDQDKPVTIDGYVTEIFGNKAIEAIERAPSDKPFFLSLHFTAPHFPWEGPNDREAAREIDNIFHLDGGNIEIFGEMVRSMDDQVGKLLAFLEQKGMSENTIVIFTSDNGGERFSDTWPLVGGKTELLEGGIRVPQIFRWPARIPAGTTTDQTAMSMDMLPTLAAAAGITPDESFPCDGENLLPVLFGADSRPRELFWRYKAFEQAAFRDGDWKYLSMNGKEYLFDLAADQRERANLALQEPERMLRMKRRFVAWNANMLPYSILTQSHSNKETGGWVDRY